ncbi:carboxypeptidase-like regulatory domain-containing protein [Sphingobacterium suaedae]|uniref:Carboxypeptidase-like regulatory domain-containing protein n=1 Tax=Sphingobacterium suaedae TaxID=1686402 RepID=A0ABW5KLK4_9SPHI
MNVRHSLKSIFIVGIFLVLVLHLRAQDRITGFVLDKKTAKPIPSASINIKSADGKIRSFRVTDKNGAFSVELNASYANCLLEINHLGYERYQQAFSNQLEHLRIELTPQTILLEGVTVKSKPKAYRLGDTLTYDVGSFATQEDRSIGDVIKRLPGMEVSDNGQIKYQGKSITNFYIDGDDLLDDRYAIGSRTIPHKLVQDIQVLNNHEHIKVLKDKRFTDQVAINLVVKPDARLTLTGEVKLGIGSPKIYDSELNTILFNKKYKTLNVLNGNNRGTDLSNDFIGYNENNVLARIAAMPINNLLSLGTVAPPPLDKQQYLMNNTVALNTNHFVHLKRHWQMKSNAQVLYDRQTAKFNGSTTFTTPTDRFTYSEQQQSESSKLLTALRLTLTKNAEKEYVNSVLAFEYENDDGIATIRTGDQSLDVGKKHRIHGFSHDFDYVPALKNGHIIQTKWQVQFGKTPQTMTITPGIFPTLLNDSANYASTAQYIKVPTFFSLLSAGYHIPNGKIKQYYSGALAYENKQFVSQIETTADRLPHPVDSITNDLLWRRVQYTLNATYSWKSRRWAMQWSLPLTSRYTAGTDASYGLHSNQRHWIFLPSLDLKYRVWQEDELNLSYTRTANFEDIQDLYRGIVIRNYRSLAQNSTTINKSSTHSATLQYRMGRTTKLLFANFGLQFRQTHREAMLSQRFSNDISQTILLPLPNKTRSISLHAGIDKYVFFLSSTVKWKGGWSSSVFDQLFNDQLLPFQSSTFFMQPRLELKIAEQLHLTYQGHFSWSSSKQKHYPNLSNRVFSATQIAGIPYTPFPGLLLRINGKHSYTSQSTLQPFHTFFIDAFTRCRIKKWKTDLELSLNNLADIKTFETYSITANEQTQNSYDIRGRTIMLRMIFAL